MKSKGLKVTAIILGIVLLLAFIGALITGLNLFKNGVDKTIDDIKDYYYNHVSPTEPNSAIETPSGSNIKSLSLDIPTTGKLELKIPAADVIVKMHDSNKINAILDAQPAEKYSLSHEIDEDGDLQIRLHVSRDIHITSHVKLTVLLPKGLTELDVDLSAGYLHVAQINVPNLDLDLSAGKADIESSTFNQVKIDMAAGMIVLKNNTVTKSMNIDIAAGNMKLIVPKDKGFLFECETQFGKPNINLPTTDLIWHEGGQNANFRPSGKTSFTYKTETYKIDASIATGNLTVTTTE